MLKRKKLLVIGLITAMTLTVALSGCGDNTQTEGSNGELSGTVVIAGSTSVQPLSEELAEAFMDKNKNVSVEVQGGGSGQGIKAIEQAIADFGALSREVKEEEKAEVKTETIIAKDGVAVVVNPECTVKDLTLDQIQKIYTGEIKNWKEVGGEDAEIVVVTREEGSGTRGAFTEITKVLSKDEAGKEIDNTIAQAIVQPSTGAVKQTVATTPNSIGYVSLGSLDDTVKAVSVEGVAPSSDTVVDGSYKISRPFIYVTGAELSEAAQAYVDFVMSEEGQAIVAEEFIPVK
ncbi:phosphate ABC transporter substrate-binding protein [Sinanaerobacter sp. ZZT-01]|uniref:phosphate ABC transporter substrate-binding protein n=1 Tax=Sinanaerobacter sp. ZZT-01 TaxID=3111540 RepID=UPI002D7A09BB|nr:phosphate ABC transporter substrate-binding protein [Sinanaerobacter sp. ZZT-01]WRR94304.1 phosphate ABC transporter substrate-binding protein [Sinanaerobacter sp. ZZT-01]